MHVRNWKSLILASGIGCSTAVLRDRDKFRIDNPHVSTPAEGAVRMPPYLRAIPIIAEKIERGLSLEINRTHTLFHQPENFAHAEPNRD